MCDYALFLTNTVQANMMQESDRTDSNLDESEQKMTPEELQKKEELEAELAKVSKSKCESSTVLYTPPPSFTEASVD